MNKTVTHMKRISSFNRFYAQLNVWSLGFGIVLCIISGLIFFFLSSTIFFAFNYGLGLVGSLLIGEWIIHRDKDGIPYSNLSENQNRVEFLKEKELKKSKVFGLGTIFSVMGCFGVVILQDEKTFLYSLVPITLFLSLKMVKSMIILFQTWILKDELARIKS